MSFRLLVLSTPQFELSANFHFLLYQLKFLVCAYLNKELHSDIVDLNMYERTSLIFFSFFSVFLSCGGRVLFQLGIELMMIGF